MSSGFDIEFYQNIFVITDAGRAVALAGVMGGWDTRVTTDSRS